MTDYIREAFEEVCAPSFPFVKPKRKPNGEYENSTLEDHWQTFQEGWECALIHLKEKHNPSYTDIISDGGMDPRQ